MTADDLATAVLPAVIDRRYSQIRVYLAEPGVCAAASWSIFPFGNGISLPGRFSSGRGRRTEMKQASLGSGIGVDTESIVVFPSDMQAPWKPHDVGGAVGFALLAGCFIPGRIPGIANATALCIKREGVVHTFFWRDHAKLPVFHDDRNPVARDVERCSLARGGRWLAAASTLSRGGRRYQEHNQKDRKSTRLNS